MILAIALSSAGEPILGPEGWQRLGPLPEAGPRDRVTVDPRTCALEVERVDLDGGPANRDVRLARTWDGGWRWADDWRVEGERLLRPGRDPSPLSGPSVFQGATLETDADGRVTSRMSAGRRIEILRDATGTFTGMKAGPVDVRVVDDTRGQSSDGRSVRWRRDGGALAAVTDARATTAYTYDQGQLSGVRWADGSMVTTDTRRGDDGTTVTTVKGIGGEWVCTASATRTALRGPEGAWVLTRTGGVESLTDPTGATTRTSWVAGRLMAWTDPLGSTTRVSRDGLGRVVQIDPPDGARWSVTWRNSALATLTGPDAGIWQIERDARGLATGLVEPGSRATAWEWDGSRLRAVRLGSARHTLTNDLAGRIVSITDPAGSRTDLGRDTTGAVVSVRDAGGGRWALTRNTDGTVSRVVDPAGQTWDITRDTLGRPVSAGRVRWTLTESGRPSRITFDDGVWDLTYADALARLRDPLGQVTSLTRDALGRVVEVQRADGEPWRIRRDAAGNVVGVGDVHVQRDLLGRPLSVRSPTRAVSWDRDVSGRVVGVTAPGATFSMVRDRTGNITRVGSGDDAIALERDAQGRVVQATAAGRATLLSRDAAGRIIRVVDGDEILRVDRDVRGLETRFQRGAQTWSISRDAAGRPILVEAPGARLGIDRTVEGEPALVRLTDGTLAQITRSAREILARVSDRDGRLVAELGWSFDKAGRLERLISALPLFGGADTALRWVLRRDPLGTLVAAESGEAAWSLAPDHLDLPDDHVIALQAHLPLDASDGEGWGVGRGAHHFTAVDGAIVAVAGPRGKVTLTRDPFGRITAWRGADGEHRIVRDGFGRIVRVGPQQLVGWGAALDVGAMPVAALDGIGAAARDGGLLVGPVGPLLRIGTLAAIDGLGWYTPVSGPSLSLSAARDPISKLPLDAGWRLPWEPLDAEPGPAQSPWANPDDSATVSWDPAGWAPESPWSDPLALLVATGDLPDGGPRSATPPGLPWLPRSLAASAPPPVPDPDALPLDEEPVVAWILTHARAPTSAAAHAELAEVLLASSLERQLRLPPGLRPALPALPGP